MISRGALYPQQCGDSIKVYLTSFQSCKICWVTPSFSSREVLVPSRSCFPWAHCTQALGTLSQSKQQHTLMYRGLSLSMPQPFPVRFESSFSKKPMGTCWSSKFKSSLGKGGEGYRGSTDCISQLHASSQIDLANLITDSTSSRLTPD